MNKVITLSATEARNQFFELLNAVYFTDQQIKITKDSKPFARLIPDRGSSVNWKRLQKNLQKTAGIFTDEDVKFIEQGRENFDTDLGEW